MSAKVSLVVAPFLVWGSGSDFCVEHCPIPAEPLAVPFGFLLIPASFLLTVSALLRGQAGSLSEATGERVLVGETAAKREALLIYVDSLLM